MQWASESVRLQLESQTWTGRLRPSREDWYVASICYLVARVTAQGR
jgi:hypothetical protein